MAYIDAKKLGEAVGISAPSSDWASWIDRLPENQLDYLQGALIQRFGRPKAFVNCRSARDHVRGHLLSLEAAMTTWLDTADGLVDHFVISSQNSSDPQWWWTDEHTEYWQQTARSISPIPIPVQLIPVCCCDTFVQYERELHAPALDRLCGRLGNMTVSTRESLLGHLESVSEFMYITEDEALPKLANCVRTERIRRLHAWSREIPVGHDAALLLDALRSLGSSEYLTLHAGLEHEIRALRTVAESSPQSQGSETGSGALFDSWRDRTKD